MRQIIDNILYDTEKAELLPIKWEITKDLYLTKNGRWFCVDQDRNLEILTASEVKERMGQYYIDFYIKYFGEPEEG